MKKYGSFFCALALLLVAVFYQGLSSAEAAILPDGKYCIRLSDKDMALAVHDLEKGERATLQKDGTRWNFKHIGNNVYEIQKKGFALAMKAKNARNGAHVLLQKANGKKNQQWKLRSYKGYYTLTNVKTKLALDLSGNFRWTGNYFQGYTPNNTRAQLFKLVGKHGNSNPSKPSYGHSAVLKNGVYLIQMAHNSLTVAAESSRKKARLILWNYRPTATWAFTHLGNNEYEIRTNSMVMDSAGNTRYNGVPIIIYPKNGGKNQRWKIARAGKYYTITNVATGLALDVQGNHQRAGTRLQGYEKNGTNAQLFKITHRY